MMLVCRVEPLLGDSDRARGGRLDGFGSGSRCLYVRVRNKNAVSMQGRTSQRQTERSGLAATLVLGLSVASSRFVVCCLGQGEGRGFIYHGQEDGLCLALGLSTVDKLLC